MSAKSYDLRRAREERCKAEQAACPEERRARLRLAEIFEARARMLPTVH
jgi:hypothetical protein